MTEFKQYISNNSSCTESSKYINKTISTDYASAYIDIDADCENDILIQYDNVLEIWRGRIEGDSVKYCLNQNSIYQLEDKLGHFSIADIDRNGMLDIVFPIKDSAKILVAYNKIKLEYDWSADYCKSKEEPNNDEIFDRMIINSNNEVRLNYLEYSNYYCRKGRRIIPF
jgi:hypothetical protein